MTILAAVANCSHAISTTYGLPASLFLAGLLGSITHCTGMCGPFAISQSGQLKKLTGRLLIPYHAGRMVTYVFFTIIFYAFINLAALFSPEKGLITAPLLLLASLIFLTQAFPDLKTIFPWTTSIRIPLPFSWISKSLNSINQIQGCTKQFLTGIILGFMPCGLVVAAIMATSTAQTLPMAILGMMSFTLGTMPALTAIGLGGKFIREKYPRFSPAMTRGVFIWNGLWLLSLAGILIFNGILS